MKWWAIPSWSGDFRIEPDPESTERSVLTVVKPTPGEVEALKRFEKKAVKKGWTELARLHEREKTILVAPVEEVGAAMLGVLGLRRRGILTAIAMESGKIKTTEIVTEKDLPVWLREKKEEGGKAVATVKRPSLSCPECSGRPEADRMPCDVLWEFLDEVQRKEWLRRRAITVFGHLSGHCYRVAARDTEAAAIAGRCTIDLDDRTVLHAYDWAVPPEEEVLGLKLMLEHRENWIRVSPEVDRWFHDRWGGMIRGVFSNPLPLDDGYMSGGLAGLVTVSITSNLNSNIVVIVCDGCGRRAEAWWDGGLPDGWFFGGSDRLGFALCSACRPSMKETLPPREAGQA